MNRSRLIFIDKIFSPFYHLSNWSKSVWPQKMKNVKHTFVVKFFGLGSLTRIAYVIKHSNVSAGDITFITLYRNKTIIDQLNLNACYIRTNNPFCFVQDAFKILFNVWRTKQARVFDMERASNLSGIFRIALSIRKPAASFYFDPENKKKGNQRFISLDRKPAIKAIAEMFHQTEWRPANLKARKTTGTPTVLININAGDYFPQRMFPLEQFAALVTQLHFIFPSWVFILTGLSNEQNRVHAFECLLESNGVNKGTIKNLCGKQNLTEMLTHIESSALMITNDSGPLHCAQLAGTKTVGIWGPTSAELVGYPDSDHMLNITPSISCSPCFLHPKSEVAKACNGQLTCFQEQDIDSMAAQISQFIETDHVLNHANTKV